MSTTSIELIESHKVFCAKISASFRFYEHLLMAASRGTRPAHVDLSEKRTDGTKRHRHVMTATLHGDAACLLDLEEGQGKRLNVSDIPDANGIPLSALRFPAIDSNFALAVLRAYRSDTDERLKTSVDGTICDPDGNRICLHRRVLRANCQSAARTAKFYQALIPSRMHIDDFTHPGLVLEDSTWVEFHTDRAPPVFGLDDPRDWNTRREIKALALTVEASFEAFRDSLIENGFDAACILKKNVDERTDRPTSLLSDPDGRLVLVTSEREEA